MIDRRDFLTKAAAVGFGAAIPLSAAEAAFRTSASSTPVSDKFDFSWTSRLRGKSRAVFDGPHVEDGAAFYRAAMWRDQMVEAYGTPKEEVTPVVVFRHQAIGMVMDDQYWDRMNAGKESKTRDPQTGKKWAKRNPVLFASPDAKPPWSEYTLPKFIASGGIVLACNLAYQYVVSQYRKKDKLDRDAAKARAAEHLVPGVILQPSGFFAVLKAQDEGCNYMQGS